MKTNIQKLTFILFLAILMGCKKESDYKTEGELTGERLKEVVQSQLISVASVYFMPTGYNDAYQETFIIDGQFIQVGTRFYNLNKLISFNTSLEGGKATLDIYFEGN